MASLEASGTHASRISSTEKRDELRPGLVRDERGIAFNPSFGSEETNTDALRGTRTLCFVLELQSVEHSRLLA